MDAKHGSSEPPLSQTIDAATLDRYLAGESSSEERLIVDRWIAADVERIQWLETIRESVTIAFGTVSADANRGRTLLERRIKSGLPSPVPLITNAVYSPDRADVFPVDPYRRTDTHAPRWGGLKRQPLRQWTWPTLITLVVGIIVAITAWNAGVGHLSPREASSTLTYSTGNGQRANVTLPDGSIVALNVASRLDVPADYVTGNRTVRLTGEALFTVTHLDGHPFTVVAGSTTARVLGTSFVVRHYPTDTVTNVAVRDGKIAVHSIVLAAAQQVDVSSHGVIRREPADPSRFSFATGVLTFDGVPLRDAVVMLDRWFDADIQLGDPTLGARRVAGGFTAGSLADLKESLELTFNVRVVRDGRVLTVYPK